MSDNSILEDKRFNTVFSDPKFKKLPKHERKVKIDKRFQSMFTHDSFKVKYTVDKRGRQISKSTSEDFKRFYDLPSDEENDSTLYQDDSENDIVSYSTEESICDGAGKKVTDTESEKTFEKAKKLLKKKKKHVDSTCETFPSLNEEEKMIQKKQISNNIRQKLKDMNIDYARGESKLFSESSSDESESEESETEIYHEWNELDKDADTTNHITNRLAVCNMDWDRVRAVDLMMLFNSFLPAEGLIYSIIIYPSEFGLKRMAEEEVRGPAELVDEDVKISSDSDSDNEAEEGKQFHMERMRQYQLNRLKYYYAVATFDSPKTADIIYMNCNGVEYESSGIRLDLRFIDDDITFDQEPKDSCNNTSITKYEPLYFVNTALQQAKVELTWDETDPRRLEYTKKITEAAKTQDINDSDLENLVALSSSGEEEDNEIEGAVESTMSDTPSGHESENSEQGDPIQVYRTLLKEIEENDKNVQSEDDDVDLEIAWGAESGDNDKSAKIVKVSKKSKNEDQNEDFTPFQRLLEKKKEKSKLRRTKTLQKKENLNNEMNSEDYECDKNQKKKSKKLSTDENEEKQKKELELLLLDETDTNKHHFSLKKIKENEKLSKKKRKFKKNKNKTIEDDDFQVDVNDERFSALYASHLFNIDPTDPKFHKTKGMEAFVKEKQKRLSQKENNVLVPESEPPIKKTKDSELLSLVTSLKAKKLLPNKINKRK